MMQKIKRIVNVKENEEGKREFEVQWENTWEPEEKLREFAGDLIENFLKGHSEENNNDVKEIDDDDMENRLTIDEGMEVDELGFGKLNKQNDKEDEKDSNSTLMDLFNTPLNNGNKMKKSGKGINAIISRLQKNKQEEQSESPSPVKKRDYQAQFPLSPEEATEAPETMIPQNTSQYGVHVPASSQQSQIVQQDLSNGQRFTPTNLVQLATTTATSSAVEIHRLPSNTIFYEPTQVRAISSIANQQQQPQTIAVQHFQAAALLYKCTRCSEVFYDEEKFQQHMFMHDQVNLLKQDPPQLLKPGTYECKFCHIVLENKEKLKLHYSEKHEKEYVNTQPVDHVYQCSMCEMTFLDYNKLVQHQQTHAQRREVYILPKQQVQTGTLIALEQKIHVPKVDTIIHTPNQEKLILTTSNDLVPVKTENRDDGTATKSPMTTLDFQPVNEALLSKSKVEVRRRYRCNICDELFDTEEARAKHSLVHVNRSSSLDCHICGKQFRHRTNLSTHMIVHSGEKPHQCHICLRRFTQKVNLQRHMHIHDGNRPFICRMCSKSFTQKANLQRHILSHSECTKEDILQALNDIPNESEVNNAINESLSEAMSIVTDGKRTASDPTEKAEFQCDNCDKTFAQRVNLQKHLLIHSGTRPFQCYVCGKAFRQRSTLQKHYTLHTNGTSNFVCQSCNRLFVSKTNLQRHMLVHVAQGNNQCYLCDQSFTTADNLERHFSEHIEESLPNITLPQKYFEQSTPGQIYRCATCDIVFESAIIFSQHLRCHEQGFSADSTNMDVEDISKAYEENQSLECNQCHVVFMSITDLEEHMMTHSASLTTSGNTDTEIKEEESGDSHNNSKTTSESSSPISSVSNIKQETSIRPSRCPVCKEMFQSKTTMREHYSSVHIKADQQTHSKQTSFSSNNSDDLMEDGIDPENEDVFIKDEVEENEDTMVASDQQKDDSTSSTAGSSGITENEERLIRENLDFIKDNILGGPAEYESKGRYERGNYSCKICNRVLTYKYSLEKHMLLHTGSFPYKCTLCSKRFNHKANLDKHLVVHSGEKPYVCHICERPFSQKSNLQRHQLTHTQNRDFVCEVCGKRFNHMASLKTHSLIHTGAKPFACYVCNKRFNQKGNLKRHIQTHKNGKRNKINGLNGGEDVEMEDEQLTPDPQDVYNAKMEDIEGKSPPASPVDDDNITPRLRSERLRIKKQQQDYEFFDDDDEPLPTMIVKESDDYEDDDDEEEEEEVDVTSDDSKTFDIPKDEIVTVMPSDAIVQEKIVKKETKSVNSSPKSFPCNACSKVFISSASLDAHRKSAHSQIICEVCGKQFSQKANLLKHKLIHANKKPFPCKVCNKAFRQKANLQRHELIHSKDRKTVSCTECNKTFRCSWSLKQHMKIHATTAAAQVPGATIIPEETILLGCSICGQTFKEKEKLQQHFTTHKTSSITLFSCAVCNLKVSSKSELISHIHTHTEISDERRKQMEGDADTSFMKFEQVTPGHVITLQPLTTMIPVTQC